MKKRISILATLLLWVGCANPPQESNKLTLGMVQSNVVKGANQSEITRVLGAPNICLLYTSPSPRDATLSGIPGYC